MDYHSERSGRLDVSAGYPDFTDRLSSTQDKEAVIEMDIRDNRKETAQIIRIDADGEKVSRTSLLPTGVNS